MCADCKDCVVLKLDINISIYVKIIFYYRNYKLIYNSIW